MLLSIGFGLLLIVLLGNSLYLFVFSIAGALDDYTEYPVPNEQSPKSFLVLIPGYKEDAVILKSVEHVVNLDYPHNLFHCAVLADDFQPSTLAAIRSLGAEAFEISRDPARNKARSIQKYLDQCNHNFDACIILDADNCVSTDFLMLSNAYLQGDVKVVQAKRIAKNEHNSLSRLDALSEIINNHIFRKGQRKLGLSASLIGSGMIIDMKFFRQIMKNMNVISGFDKEMELRILKNKVTIEYAEDILVEDEKVSKHDVYVNQRRRWTYAQLFFLRKNTGNAIRELFKNSNYDYFNKVLQFALLPRVVSLGLSIIFPIITYFIPGNIFYWSVLNLILVVFALSFAVNKDLKFKDLFILIYKLPSAFFGMLQAMLTSKQASTKFIHTPHNIQ